MAILLNLYLTAFFSPVSEVAQASSGLGQSNLAAADQDKDLDGRPDFEEHTDNDYDYPVEEGAEGDVTKFTGRKKKLWELRQKMVNLCRTLGIISV